MSEPDRLLGAVVLDATGTEVGTVAALRVDPGDLRPRWIDVALAGDARSTVPVQAASADASGRVVLPFTADDLRAAPTVDERVVSADLAAALLRHYGFPPETR